MTSCSLNKRETEVLEYFGNDIETTKGTYHTLFYM